MRYLAVDYGAKRTGLAVCDAAETLASPYEVLHGPKDLPVGLVGIVAGRRISKGLCWDWPLNMDGSEAVHRPNGSVRSRKSSNGILVFPSSSGPSV